MTCLFSWFENSKGACIKHFVMTLSSSSIFRLIVVNRNGLQEFCCDLISGKLVFRLIYSTILLYDTIHVVSFRKTILISTIGTKSFKESKRQALYDKYWRNYPVS